MRLIIFSIVMVWFFPGLPQIWRELPLLPKIQEAQAAQYMRPASDEAQSGNWKNETGGTVLYTSIDESAVAISDGDYVWHDNVAGSEYFEVGLSDPGATPGSGDHIIRWRVAQIAGAKIGVVACELYQGGPSVIASDEQTLTTSYTTFEYTLLSSEVNNITDYTDLQFRFVVIDVSGTGAPPDPSISWAEFEVPDATTLGVILLDASATSDYTTWAIGQVAEASITIMQTHQSVYVKNTGSVSEDFIVNAAISPATGWSFGSTGVSEDTCMVMGLFSGDTLPLAASFDTTRDIINTTPREAGSGPTANYGTPYGDGDNVASLDGEKFYIYFQAPDPNTSVTEHTITVTIEAKAHD